MTTENRDGKGGRGWKGGNRGGNRHDQNDNDRTSDTSAQSNKEMNESQEFNVTKTNRDAHKEYSTEVNTKFPPASPSLLPQRPRGSSFGSQKQGVDTRQELKLSIEFPLSHRKSGNDIAMFLKRFMSVLFQASNDLQLLTWEGTTENPILSATDIAYDEETISQYYSGMKMQNDRNRMIGYSRILTSDPFWKLKQNNRFFDWLQTNKVWVKPTILSSSRHVKVGWLLRSHPSYTNYARATADLLRRIGVDGAELELSPHTLSHTMADGEVLRTRALKVVTTEEHSDTILDGLITALTSDPVDEWASSTTASFKLVPFRNTAISRSGITELIERQKVFLHRTMATSVIFMGTGDEQFTKDIDGKDYADGSIRERAMKAKSKDGTFLFHSIEPGRTGQGYFLHEKKRQEEAEQWLDTCFNRLLHTYGAETCKALLGGMDTCVAKPRYGYPPKYLPTSKA